MKILSMTATFGCLDGETLTLSDGLTILNRPNESGKSTWAAFVQAMFYGIDTTQRAVKGKLADKQRYLPWSGKPMSGTMELEVDGRRIVLQRTSQRNKPMSVFRAYDKDTGLEIPELTGENCGAWLLGVERGVYKRSAFLSGSELAVTEDQVLAQRLENLAVSGNLQDHYPEAENRLKMWKNRCRYHQNGLIPEKEAERKKIIDTLELISEYRQQRMALTAQREALLAEAAEAEQAEQKQWAAAKEAARDALTNLMQQEEALRSSLPRELQADTVRELQQQLRQTQGEPLPPEPDCPPALQGIDAGAVLPKAQRDLADYEAAALPMKNPWLPLWAAAAGLAVLFAVLTVWIGAGLAAAAAAGGVFLWLRKKKEIETRQQQAEAILQTYAAENKDDLLPAAMARRDWLLAQERHRQTEWEREVLLEQARQIWPEIRTQEEALSAAAQTLSVFEQLTRTTSLREKAELQHRLAAMPWHPGQALLRLKEKAAAYHLQAENLRAKEEAVGSLEKLEARKETLNGELSQLYLREQALALAQTALQSAHDQLTQVYAPQLTGLAGEYLQKLTENRYDALIMGRDWQLQAREQATGLTRHLAALSSGTQDQIWLALRLAMTRLLLPVETPLVLDDALLTFDEKRTAAALQVLRQENRQVLLLTCRVIS